MITQNGKGCEHSAGAAHDHAHVADSTEEAAEATLEQDAKGDVLILRFTC